MPLSEKRMSHPLFWSFNASAGLSLESALKRHQMTVKDIDGDLEAAAGRVVDELTSLLLRIHDKREKAKP